MFESELPMEIPTTTVENFESLKESQIIEFQLLKATKIYLPKLGKSLDPWTIVPLSSCNLSVQAWKARQRDSC